MGKRTEAIAAIIVGVHMSLAIAMVVMQIRLNVALDRVEAALVRVPSQILFKPQGDE